jgi:hypothetical protein
MLRVWLLKAGTPDLSHRRSTRQPRWACPLALDDDQRDALVSHLDGVSVSELVRRESATDAGEDCGAVELPASGGLLPVPSGGCAVDHAEQPSGAEAGAELKPWLELSPTPAIHADLATAAALSAPDKNGSAGPVKIGLGEVKRLADPKAGAPQDHDQRPEPGHPLARRQLRA